MSGEEAELRAQVSAANEHFYFVKECLQAGIVTRRNLNVYDIDPETVGQFWFRLFGATS